MCIRDRVSTIHPEISIKKNTQVTTSIIAVSYTHLDVYKRQAENFAYSDFDWTEVVLVDKWKDEKGKERLSFTDGKAIEFAIGKNRFEVLKQSELGQIFKFKLHKQEIKKEVEAKFAWLGKTVVTEYKNIPLIADKTDKENWSILEEGYGLSLIHI